MFASVTSNQSSFKLFFNDGKNCHSQTTSSPMTSNFSDAGNVPLMKDYENLMQDSLVTDSGYTSIVGSRRMSNRSSRQPSRCTSPVHQKKEVCHSPRSISPVNHRQIIEESIDIYDYSNREFESSNKSFWKDEETMEATIRKPQASSLESVFHTYEDQPDLAAEFLLQPLAEKELEKAKMWLDQMDWQHLDNYQEVQNDIQTVEEEFTKRFNVEPPLPECLDDEGYSDLVRADTMLSMVEQAWCPEPKNDYITSLVVSFSQLMTPSETHFIGNPLEIHLKSIGNPLHIQIPTYTNIQKFTSENDNDRYNPFDKDDCVSDKTSKCSSNFPNYRISAPILDNPQLDIKALRLLVNMHDSNSSPNFLSIGTPQPKREDALFNIRYKTQPCVHFQKLRQCPAGENCHFAHGPQELRKPVHHPKYKTQICAHHAATGRCPYGPRCYFRHSTQTDEIADPRTGNDEKAVFRQGFASVACTGQEASSKIDINSQRLMSV